MENNIIKKLKENIYTKPSISQYNKLYNSNKNYNNMLNELLDNNSIDNSKNIMISELDIKIDNSKNESLEEIEPNKVTKNNESKKEFKNELKNSIMKFLEKNKENKENKESFHDLKNKKIEIIPNTKKSLNLTSITPTNNKLKTFNFNKDKDKINNFITINRKSTKTKTLTINDNYKRNEFIIKKLKTKNINSIIDKNNNTTYKKLKNNNSKFNQPHKSLLVSVKKKYKNILSIYDNTKINYSNLKFNKNKSFVKDNFNRSNTLRNSFKNSFIKNNFRLKYNKIFTSNSKPKEKTIQLNNKYSFLPKTKYALTDNNCNTIKNITIKKYDINKNKFIKKRIIPVKYRNLTLKEKNILPNSNNQKNNYGSFTNNTYTKEKLKNYWTIVYEKKKLKSPLNKKLKILIKKKFKNTLNKNPINIVNININKNNNYIMNINNNDRLNMIENKTIKLSSKEGKMKKFFSFQNFFKLNENYKKNILKRIITK